MAVARVGIGLVGCGYWGKNLARNLHQLGHLTAVCDSDPQTLAGVKASYKGVRALRRFERLLEEPRVGAIAIAAPAEQHYALTRQALLAGKDAFVEKPLALRVAEAEELVGLAARKKRV